MVTEAEDPVDEDPDQAYQEWVNFFFANDKNKIELEWVLESDDDDDSEDNTDDPVTLL